MGVLRPRITTTTSRWKCAGFAGLAMSNGIKRSPNMQRSSANSRLWRVINHFMPKKPLSPCLWPGCSKISEPNSRYCTDHKATADKAERDRRGTSTQRGYGARWQRLRLLILARDPVCRYPGCGQLSTDVDHIVSKAKGGSDEENNLQGLCHEHHSLKTAQKDGGFGRYRP